VARRYEYDDSTVMAVDFGTEEADASVDVVDDTVIVVPTDDDQYEIELPANSARTRTRLSKRRSHCRTGGGTMKLTVKPLKQKDAGRGLAAIDRVSMNELDLENGDYIVIKGKSEAQAVARVWPGYPEDEGRGIVRIDGRLRQEADVGIDDNVTIEPADVKPAKSVTVALPQNLRIRGDIGAARPRQAERAGRYRGPDGTVLALVRAHGQLRSVGSAEDREHLTVGYRRHHGLDEHRDFRDARRAGPIRRRCVRGGRPECRLRGTSAAWTTNSTRSAR